MSADDSGVKGFWSRRKAAVRKAEEAESAQQEEIREAAKVAELEQKSDAEILEELGLPDPDTMTMEDDFKRFLVKTVPERLRRRALRRLWISNPVLANLDGLNDYDEDFTDIAVPEGGVRTAYQVGRGFLDQFRDDAPEKSPASEELRAEETAGPAVAGDVTESGSEHDSAAMQNTYDENGSPSNPLTPVEKSVHSADNGAIDSEETTPVEIADLRPLGRRRLRFDYE
ncbi:DUF3306 domain-containing protein [Rhodobacterales bacterium]|nr:DUF3306 domain-containing protein [Rhodobacterales bacterium]